MGFNCFIVFATSTSKGASIVKILYVINILQTGGAELQMINLAKTLTKTKGVKLKIISLKEKGDISGNMLLGLDVDIIYLGLNFRNILYCFYRLLSEIKEFKPDAIHSWMYHSNLFLSLALFFSSYHKYVIWSIHHNDLSIRNNKLSTLIVSKISVLLSHIFKPAIVFVSDRAKYTHLNSGYSKKNAIVIENAIDLEYFKYNEDARKRIVNELGLPDNSLLVGYFGRFDVIKNHHGFLHGMNMFFEKNLNSNVYLIMAGSGISKDNQELVAMIKRERLDSRVKLLGIRTDMPAIYSSIDLCVLMSFNESFSLVLVEAMSCGAVCIASSEADPIGILEAGNKLPENTPNSFCCMLSEFINDRIEKKRSSKKSISMHSLARFDLKEQAKKYMTLYKNMPLTIL